MPASYEPPIAESWVFVQPRYLTSRAIGQYALPIAALGPVFLSATTVYRPQFRGGVVYNYGMPRDRVVKIIRRPIVVEKVYRFDRKDQWKGGAPGKGVKVYAPGFARNDQPHRPPKRFVDNPNAFKPKARLQETYHGDVPKGWGRSAKGMVSVTKETSPDAWKKKQWSADRDDGKSPDKDKWQPDRSHQGEAARDEAVVPPAPHGPGGAGMPQGQPNFKQGQGDHDQQKSKKNKQQFGAPGGPGGPGGFDGGMPPKQFDQFDQGNAGSKNKNRQQFGAPGGPGGPSGMPPKQVDQFDQGNAGGKHRNKQQFGGPGGPGGPDGGTPPKQFDQFDQGNGGGNKNRQQFGAPGGPDGGGRAQGGDDGGGGQNKKKQAKCDKNPDHPGCQ
jgi:hypothetical protein